MSSPRKCNFNNLWLSIDVPSHILFSIVQFHYLLVLTCDEDGNSDCIFICSSTPAHKMCVFHILESRYDTLICMNNWNTCVDRVSRYVKKFYPKKVDFKNGTNDDRSKQSFSDVDYTKDSFVKISVLLSFRISSEMCILYIVRHHYPAISSWKKSILKAMTVGRLILRRTMEVIDELSLYLYINMHMNIWCVVSSYVTVAKSRILSILCRRDAICSHASTGWEIFVFPKLHYHIFEWLRIQKKDPNFSITKLRHSNDRWNFHNITPDSL